jgi:aldose sugar dehydrogenase
MTILHMCRSAASTLAGILILGWHCGLNAAERPPQFGDVFNQNCAVCHGENLQGAAQGTPLVGQSLKHGEDISALMQSIAEGYPQQGMPAWKDQFDQEQIKSMALWILENRSNMLYSDFNITRELTIPAGIVHTEQHKIRIQSMVRGLDPLPYSITVLPDNSLLVTEKMRGIRQISSTGEISPLIQGTPAVFDDTRVGGGDLQYGMGWLLDIAVHPNYADNGWIYLHYTDRCSNCNAISKELNRPVSMNRLVRGRIRDGHWVDQQDIWQAALEDYSPWSDVPAGGRITFDAEGFVFISIGMKSMDGIQDLTSPHGKILRLRDNGDIPTDNPFVDNPDALPAIWTYGHRSPQGLEFDPRTRTLWGTEHGPRGGDEVNLLLPGHNYGWPMFSKGQNYDGTLVTWGKKFGIETELADIDQPIVDLTPSPAISSFVIYNGVAFPGWQNNLIVGSLKAADLYRFVITDNKLVHKEVLVENLARIRDIEVGQQGELYVLLEHNSGGQIVRIVPDVSEVAGVN